MDKETFKAAKGFWSSTKGYRDYLSVAFIFDLLSMIPWVGMIFSFLGYATLWLWFEMNGINPSLFSGKKKAKKAASFFFEWMLGIIGFGIYPGIVMWAYYAISEHTDSINQEKLSLVTHSQSKASDEVGKSQRVKTSAY